jgi:predicted RNase H-like nuclease (RuvC/YqgF family)
MNNNQPDLGQGFNNIEQIRELLFGTQLKQLSIKLDSLETMLKEQKEETEKRISVLKIETDRSLQKLQESLSTELQTSFRSLSEELKSLKEKNIQDREENDQQLESISKRLSSNVANLDEAIDKQTRSLRDDVLSSHKKLQSDLIQMKKQVVENFEKRLANLGSSKVSREDIADMFFEIVLKLKGTQQLQLQGMDFPPTWEENAEAKKSDYLLLEESQDNEE